jgi:hypothetical protein
VTGPIKIVDGETPIDIEGIWRRHDRRMRWLWLIVALENLAIIVILMVR